MCDVSAIGVHGNVRERAGVVGDLDMPDDPRAGADIVDDVAVRPRVLDQ